MNACTLGHPLVYFFYGLFIAVVSVVARFWHVGVKRQENRDTGV